MNSKAGLLSEKVVIVTGGCSGIGWGITQAAIDQGATVIACQRSEGQAKERIGALRDKGADAHFLRADVSKPEDITRFVDQVIADHGRIDVLINNAGVTIEKDFFEMEVDILDTLWATNQRSIFLMSQACAHHMRAQGGGAIVNVASNHATASVPGYEMYAATKGGIVAMTKAMAWSLGPHQIRVNTLSPGLTATEAIQDMADGNEHLKVMFDRMHATGAMSTVEEVAGAAIFLASDMAAAITGTEVTADKGLTALLVDERSLK